MKKTVILFAITIFFLTATYSQSIPSYWMNIYDLESYENLRKGEASKIVVKITGYLASRERYKEEITYEFLSTNTVSSRKRNGELTRKISNEYDENGLLKRRTDSANNPVLGWQVSTIEYEFSNKGKRLKETQYDENLELTRIIKYDYDDHGRLEKISNYSPQKTLISYETAEYNIKESFYIYRIFNAIGNMVSEQKRNFNIGNSNPVTNEYGDIINVIWPTSSDENIVYHTFEYKYDKIGNWTRLNRYILTDEKKTKRMTVKRKIYYQ